MPPPLLARATAPDRPWWRELTRYHWFVFLVAALGWLFDTMDQQLFAIARPLALRELRQPSPGESPEAARNQVAEYGGYATAVFMAGWAVGGVIFGVLGDRLGRARTMILTILLYSLFTGLSALSRTVWDFVLFRFLTGLGVGGEFAVGVALVAEAMPERARPYALGLLQASSAIGNISAALIGMGLGALRTQGTLASTWRPMFLVGALPALLAVLVMRKLKEPERWQAVAVQDKLRQRLGSLRDLFGHPRWRRNAVVGLLLAFSGVVGLWGIAFFSFDLVRRVFRQHFEGQGLAPNVIDGRLDVWVGIASMLLNFGAFWGIYAFTSLAQRVGRKPAFAAGFLAAMLSTALTFWYLKDFSDVFWMMPLMGFCMLSVFGGYAIYFPELFPTRLRSTGTSFCYNVGRLVAAVGPLAQGILAGRSFTGLGQDSMRYAGVAMCSFLLIGLAVLPFAPETRGQPLPE